jgi:hypothetical protein
MHCYQLVVAGGVGCFAIGYIYGCLVTIQDWKETEAKQRLANKIAEERMAAAEAFRSAEAFSRHLSGEKTDGKM